MQMALICYQVLNYSIAYGPRDIVERIVGMSTECALEAFRAFMKRIYPSPDDDIHKVELRLATTINELIGGHP